MSDSSSLPMPPEPGDHHDNGSPPPPPNGEIIGEPEPAEVLFPPPRPRPRPAEAVLWLIVFVGVQLGVGLGVGFIGMIWKMATEGPRAAENVQATVQELLGPIVIISILFTVATGFAIPSFVHRGEVWRRLAVRGIRPLHLLLVLGAVVPLLIVMTQVALWVLLLRNGPAPKNPEAYKELEKLPWALMLLLGAVAPAVGEETFFRGFLGRGLVGRFGPLVGVLITSLLFGVMHLDSVEHIVATTFLGLVLHATYLLTKTLAAPVLMHMCNNSLAFGIQSLADKAKQEGIDLQPLGDADKLPVALSATAAAALLGLGILLYQTRSRWLLPDGGTWSPGYVTAEMPPASVEAVPVRRYASWQAVAAATLTWAAFAAALGWEIVKG